MAFSLLPKEIKFFDLFDQQTAIIISAAACFKELADQGKFFSKRFLLHLDTKILGLRHHQVAR